MINPYPKWLAVLGTSTLVLSQLPALAQSSLHYLGRAVGGQSITLDMNSITPVSRRSVDFVYYLGQDERYSQANCTEGTWTTFEDGEVRRPQSETTAEMMRIVCEALSYDALAGQDLWRVFAPPSNVRVSPNGPLQCVVHSVSAITVYDWDGEWALTDICGREGYIHSSQIEPID